MKKTNLYLVILFVGYIGGFFILHVVMPDRDFSVIENRNLQSFPHFGIDAIVSGKYMEDIDEYVIDQFPQRDHFVAMKSKMEILLGKDENNDVYITKDNILIDQYSKPNYEIIDANIKSIQSFSSKVDIPVHLSLIPTQNDIYAHLLPKGAPIYKQKEVIDNVYKQYQQNIPIYDQLMEHRDEYIYYKTDHHWTSLGAYYGYQSIIQYFNQTPIELPSKELMSNEFYGTIFSKSGFRSIPRDDIYIYTPNQKITITNEFGVQEAMLYDETKLQNKDQYELFLGGNHPLVEIQGTGEDKIMIVKDSYTNALVPFLTSHFEEIHLIDMRLYKGPLSNYIEEHQIDEVLINYAISNFSEDKNLIMLR